MTQFACIEDVMRRAIELASQGRGLVEPNPMVGAVIVSSNLELKAEGWHQKFGGPHAEVDAIANAGDSARGATLVVTLEPCNHSGKTPPCTEAILAAGISRVVIGAHDPARHVVETGIARLQREGIVVEAGLCEREAKRLILPFRRLQIDHRPWIQAKWAMTWDGKIATRTGHSQWISGEASRAIVHQLRGVCDAILVGAGTAEADDPLLTARPASARVATRIVLDSKLRISPQSRLVTTAKQYPTLVVTASDASHERRIDLERNGVEVLRVPLDRFGRLQWDEILADFGRRRWTNLLVEGGSEVLGSLFDHDLIDEAHVFVGPKIIGDREAKPPLAGTGVRQIPSHASFDFIETRTVGPDVYLHGIRETREP